VVSDLRVSAEVLVHASGEFGAVAQELRAGLGSIDDEVGTLLGGSWTGEASSSYGAVWREWHEGASKVLQGLTAMSALLADAASRYSQSDQAGASGIDGAGV
jgi:WXG100 family type VII secretion target